MNESHDLEGLFVFINVARLSEAKNLPDDPKILQAMIRERIEAMADQDRKIETLTGWVNQLRRHQFGKKSEILSDENQRLLGFVEGTLALKPEPTPEPPEPPSAPKKGHGRARIPKELPRDLILHDVSKGERRCACCKKELVPIGQVKTEQAEYLPAAVHAKLHVRMKYGCPDTECRGTVVVADLPPQAVSKSKAGPGMLAFVVDSKYNHHLPLYRIEQILSNHGFPVHRSTLWEWVRGAAEAVFSVYAAMKEDVQGSEIVETDETPVRLRDREHKIMKQARQWTYLNDEHTVYEFSPDRKSHWPEAFLANTKGTLLSDAYSGYRSIARESGGRLTNAFCMAHLRRKFWNALDTDRERALVALAYIRTLYHVEDAGKPLSPSRRKALREEKSKPILEKFKAWMGEEGLGVRPKSPIGKALAYGQKNWMELTRFLEDGRLRIDNNRSEQQLRPIAVGRKNWLRYESERGGRAAAILSSLVASCRRHRKNPFAYFRDVLSRLPTYPARKIRDLTPSHWKPPSDTS